LCATTVSILVGNGEGQGGSAQWETSLTARVLAHPGGAVLVGVGRGLQRRSLR
jgi:hypothetical protein